MGSQQGKKRRIVVSEKDKELYQRWVAERQKIKPTDVVTEKDLRKLEAIGYPAGKTPERPFGSS